MCMLSSGDEEWQILECQMRVAEMAHRCDECRITIQEGWRYEYVRGSGERWLPGDRTETYYTVNRTCQRCMIARRWLEHACGGYLFGTIGEDLENHVDGDEWEERTWPLIRLFSRYRRRWEHRDPELGLWSLADLNRLVDRAIVATDELNIRRRVMPGPVPRRA